MIDLMRSQRARKGFFNEKTTRSAESVQKADEILDSWTDEL